MVQTLKDRTIFISGGSRGIGLAIAKRAARDGANVTIAAKTAEPHPKRLCHVNRLNQDFPKTASLGESKVRHDIPFDLSLRSEFLKCVS